MQKFIILCITFLSVSFAKSQSLSSPPSDESKEIIFASDTQAPMLVERLLTKADHNRTATKMIFNNILRCRPASLFLLGDVVNLGYSNRQWKPIDGYLKELRKEGVMVTSALGNHEVLGKPKKGQQKFQMRFPDYHRTGYVEVVDSVAVILLNSNFHALSAREDAEQINWYQQTLKKLDADSSIQFIITGCHHPPYTNSTVVSPSAGVQQKFVPLFLASKKSQLFVSGHCHGFEHYQVKGKDFLVIGGGGGLHQPLKQQNEVLPDLSTNYKPMFHYLSIKRIQDHLEVTSRELKADFTGFDDGLTLDIKEAGASLGTYMANSGKQVVE